MYLGKSGCIRANCCIRGKWYFIDRERWLFWAKVIVFWRKWLYLGKVVVFGQKLLFSHEVVVFGQKWLYSGKVALFGQGGFVP